MPLEAENGVYVHTLNLTALVPIVQEDEWAPGLIWSCVENLAPTLFRTPSSPARNRNHGQFSRNLVVLFVK